MGRTGKPQKSGKHRKIKAIDPFYFGDRKDRKQNQRDMRPKNGDCQEFPWKLKRLMKDASDIHNYSARKRKKLKALHEQRIVDQGMKRPLEPVPKFKQRKGESERAFMGRVERETQHVILKSKLEDKFKVKFQESEDGEEVVIKKKGLSKKKKERLKEKKQKKKDKKQEKISEKKLEFDQFKDEVKFGEVVQEPPCITAKPRKSNHIGHPNKPGQRSLLLKDIISQNSVGGNTGVGASKRQVGETVKRKLLSPAQQLLMDIERDRAIGLYRQLKGKKLKVS